MPYFWDTGGYAGMFSSSLPHRLREIGYPRVVLTSPDAAGWSRARIVYTPPGLEHVTVETVEALVILTGLATRRADGTLGAAAEAIIGDMKTLL